MAGRNDAGFAGLLTRDEAIRRCHVERLRGGTVVFTNGVFDLLHRGHLDYLHDAQRLGTLLIVGLNTDESVRRLKGTDRPICNQADRADALLALRWVNHVVFFDDDTPAGLIADLSPHVLVKGGDYKAESVVGYHHVTSSGGKVVILPYREGYSTTNLIETILKKHS